MSARLLASEIHAEELLLHLARLPAPRSRATTPEAVEATLAYVCEVFAARDWQVTDQPCRSTFVQRGIADSMLGKVAGWAKEIPGCRGHPPRLRWAVAYR